MPVRAGLVLLLAAGLLWPAAAHAQTCCAPPQALPDLRVTGLEVTQGVQKTTLPAVGKQGFATYDGVSLVAHRTTVVRLYANVAGTGTAKLVGATLTGTHGGHPLPGSPLASQDGLMALAPGRATVSTAERADARRGFTFTLPDSWTKGTIRLRGRIAGIGVVYGGGGGECAPAACAANDLLDLRGVKFRSTGSERVAPVRLDGWGAVPAPRAALTLPGLLQPLADGAFQFRPDTYGSAADVTQIARAATLGDLAGRCSGAACALAMTPSVRAAATAAQLTDASLVDQTCKDIGAPPPCPDLVAGIAGAPAGALGALARGTLGASALPVAVTSAAAAAHELGHGLGRRPAAGCGSGLGGVGLDIRPGSGDGGRYQPIPPDWPDYMSACAGFSWTSVKGWEDAFAALRAYGKAHGRLAAVAPRAGLRVVGFSVGDGPFVVWSARPAVAVVPPDDKAGYRAVVRSRTGTTLGGAALRAVTAHVDGGADVTIVDGLVPLKGATALKLPGSVADLLVSKGANRLVTRQRSLHAPTLRLTAPKAGLKLKSGKALKVTWKAADADGDALTAAVDYSADGGRTFRLVASGPSTGSASIPSAMLSGAGNAVVRVRVSDGFDQTSRASKTFRTPGRAPQVTVDRPVAGTVPAGVPLRLAGSAYDDRFAPLDERSLSWTLDGKAVAGGARATLDPLPVGRHVVRLVAADAAGRRRGAAVKVSVAAVTPQPLSVSAPAKISTKASSVTLDVASVAPARLGIAGAGVTRRTLAVSRAAQQVSVAVKPGSSALRLQLTFRSGPAGTREIVIVDR